MIQGRNREYGAFDELIRVQCSWIIECKAEGVARNKAGDNEMADHEGPMNCLS